MWRLETTSRCCFVLLQWDLGIHLRSYSLQVLLPGRLLSCQPCTDFICKTDILIFEFFQSLFCLSHKRRICLECQIVVSIKDTDLHLKKLEKGTCFMVHKNYCFPKIALKLLFRKFWVIKQLFTVGYISASRTNSFCQQFSLVGILALHIQVKAFTTDLHPQPVTFI